MRVGVFLLGAGFIGVGLALSVLPGPFTIPFVFAGLVIWSLEFEWAERWLDKAKVQAQEAWESARARPVRSGLSLAASLLLLGAGLWAAVHWDVTGKVTGALT